MDARHTPTGTSLRRGGALVPIVLAVALVAVISAVGWILLGGLGASGDGDPRRDLHTVARGRFDVIVPASGELQALRQVDVVNQLEQRAVLTEIIEEGSYVKKDDILFRIADEEITNKIKDAEDTFKTAEAARVAASTALEVKRSAAASEYDKAELAVDLAELALASWEKGEERVMRENLQTARDTAEINFERLQRKYEESVRLHQNNHISFDELEQDRIAMIESKARVTTATLELEVYLEYTLKQDQAKKNSDLEQAQAELGRVKQRNEAEIGNAVAALASAEYKVSSAKERLDDLREQFGYCTVKAPSSGLVVYATSLESNRWGGGGSERTLQIGTELFPKQPVILLPDTSQMIASVKVNEALSGRIRPGQQAVVTSDALPSHPIAGEVLSIGVLAESSGWRDPNRRDYTVRVLLKDADPELGLKPSMRCKANIIVESVEDAVNVPIQAVFRRSGSSFVYVPEGAGYARRDVTVGRASELSVEILAGLTPGEQVLLRAPTEGELAAPTGEKAPEVAEGEGGKESPGGERRGPRREIADQGSPPRQAGM